MKATTIDSIVSRIAAAEGRWCAAGAASGCADRAGNSGGMRGFVLADLRFVMGSEPGDAFYYTGFRPDSELENASWTERRAILTRSASEGRLSCRPRLRLRVSMGGMSRSAANGFPANRLASIALSLPMAATGGHLTNLRGIAVFPFRRRRPCREQRERQGGQKYDVCMETRCGRRPGGRRRPLDPGRRQLPVPATGRALRRQRNVGAVLGPIAASRCLARRLVNVVGVPTAIAASRCLARRLASVVGVPTAIAASRCPARRVVRPCVVPTNAAAGTKADYSRSHTNPKRKRGQQALPYSLALLFRCPSCSSSLISAGDSFGRSILSVSFSSLPVNLNGT